MSRRYKIDVIGAVQMWGVVEMHETGMRAEFASPVALHAPYLRRKSKQTRSGVLASIEEFSAKALSYGLGSSYNWDAPALAAAYQSVLVEDISELSTLAERHGKPLG
jgi:hypothetical protein